MYESKKQSAQRTIEKKDSKLQEIETVRSSFNFVFWLQSTLCCENFHVYTGINTKKPPYTMYMQLHGTYTCCKKSDFAYYK